MVVTVAKPAEPERPATPAPPRAAPAPERSGLPLPDAVRAALLEGEARRDAEDAARFRAAHARLAEGDASGARKAFYELIMKSPGSPLVPYAYLAFGDLFMAEGEQGDEGKYPLARQAYLEVLKYPAPANRAHAYATHRRGVIDRRTGQPAEALAAQRSAITACGSFRGAAARGEVLEAARAELVLAYADAGAPEKAVAFFRMTDTEGAEGLIARLGEEYARRRATREALALYASALSSARSIAICDAAERGLSALSEKAEAKDRAAVARAETDRRARCTP